MKPSERWTEAKVEGTLYAREGEDALRRKWRNAKTDEERRRRKKRGSENEEGKI
jgi:hypothetical protein